MKTIYTNKAHQRAYENGYKAAQNEAPFCPYGTDNRSSLDFRRAWMRGYDAGRAAAGAGDGAGEASVHA